LTAEGLAGGWAGGKIDEGVQGVPETWLSLKEERVVTSSNQFPQISLDFLHQFSFETPLNLTFDVPYLNQRFLQLRAVPLNESRRLSLKFSIKLHP
jgi:hypothetical protein